jgi:DHA1 family tetracycline resistance protein-like MFS transporter
MGGVLGEINIHLPFYAAGGLALANWLYGLAVLPESLPKERRAHLSLRRLNPLGVFAGLARYRMVFGMAMSLLMLNLAMFGLHATWVLYTAHRYGWSERDVGLSLALVGIGAAIVQAGLARKIIPALGPGAIGEKRAVMLGVALAVLAYAGYGAATQGWMIYVIIAVASLGGIAGPAAQALITKSVRPYEQGAVQGALTGLQSLANIGGPILGSTLFAYAISGRAVPPLDAPGLNYFASAALAACGLVIAMVVTRRVRADLGPETAEHSGRAMSEDAAAQQGEANAATKAMKSSESTKPE